MCRAPHGANTASQNSLVLPLWSLPRTKKAVTNPKLGVCITYRHWLPVKERLLVGQTGVAQEEEEQDRDSNGRWRRRAVDERRIPIVTELLSTPELWGGTL